MKKIISFALAIMMVATMSVTAFAATIDNNNPNASIPVKGTYQSGSGATGEGTISVDVSWSAMEFTYTGASQGEWNPDIHDYKDGTAGSWSTNKGTITVKNHSDVAVTASYEFKATTGLNVTGTFYTKGEGDNYTAQKSNEQNFELESAVGKTRDDNEATKDQTPKKTIYFGITDGSIDKDYNTADGAAGLGTITVKIAKKASTSN